MRGQEFTPHGLTRIRKKKKVANITVERPKKNVIITRAFVKGKEVGDARFEGLRGNGAYRLRIIYVQLQHRKRGIGALLIKAGMQQEDVHKIILSCHENELIFYLRLGFRIIREKMLKGYDLEWQKT